MGVSFAIPIRTAMNAVEQLKATGSVQRGQLGVQVRDVQSEELAELGLKTADGAFVASVQNGSPAAKAGIRAGDVITAFNGQAVVESSDLPPLVGALKPGSKAQVTLLRDGRRQSVPVVLTALDESLAAGPGRPAAPADAAKLGFSVTEVTPATRRRLDIAEVAACNKALAGIKSGERVRLLVRDEQSTAIVVLEMP